MTVDDLKELDSLMKASRYRAFHVASLVIGLLVLASSQISWIALDSRTLMNLVVWCIGCFGVVIFMGFWVRGCVLASRRLTNLIHYDTLEVRDAAITRIRFFYLIPFGYELEVNLVGGEHLTFGFWSEYDAHKLHDLLVKAHHLAAAKKQRTGLEGS